MIETSNQHVRARADSDCCACGCSTVVTRERTLAEIGGRGEHCPQDYARLEIADISAKLGDRAGVVLSVTRLQGIGALKLARRSENETPSGLDVTGKVSGANRSPSSGMLRCRRRRSRLGACRRWCNCGQSHRHAKRDYHSTYS